MGIPHCIDLGIDGYLLRDDARKIFELAFIAPGNVLELGTHKGLSTTIIARALAQRGDGSVETVDSDADANVFARENVAKSVGAERVTFTLLDAAARMDQLIAANAKFGFIFIDHTHGYEATFAAASRVKALLHPAGWVLFHDFLDPGNAEPDHPYGVYQAVLDTLCCDDEFRFAGYSGSTAAFQYAPTPTDPIDAKFNAAVGELQQFLRHTAKLRDFHRISCELQAEVYGEALDDEFFAYLNGAMCFHSFVPPDTLREGANVLDVGFGKGRALLAIAKLYKMRGHGVDKFTYAETAHGEGQKRIYAAMANAGAITLSPFDIERTHLPYPSGSFSLVICEQMIEHLHNSPKLMLSEIARVLEPGGALVLDTPNHAYWGNRIKLLRGESVHWDLETYFNYGFSTPHPGEYFGHTREFTPDELSKMAAWVGLEVEVATSVAYGPVLAGRELENHYLQILRNEIEAAYGVEIDIKPPPADAPPRHHLLATSILVARKR
ncbi:MAG: methyltransferase domain-containing protein [Hyphomonadaceae bacterium]